MPKSGQTIAIPAIAILAIALLAGTTTMQSNNRQILYFQESTQCIADENCPEEEICCQNNCIPPACINDSGCDDNSNETIDVCNQDATCESYCTNIQIAQPCTTACSSDAECDDESPDTTDICNNDATCESSCSHAKTEPSCTITCSNDADCDDGKEETIGTCNNRGTCESSCTNIEQKTEIELPWAEQGETKSKRLGNKTMTLHKSRKNFAANDTPSLSISILAQDGTPADARVEAFLTLPDGSVKQIDAKRIKKAGNGKFTVEAAMPRSSKAGTYSITIRASDGTETAEETMQFEWGLIAVNTRKSIYRPGETTEFEIVVLDRESYGVAGAEVMLSITLPDGGNSLLSTANGLVKETTTRGIYIADFTVPIEGTYAVQASAKANDINTAIETTFDARQEFEYDIERITATKIDPAQQPNTVEINITAMQGQKNADIIERVPKEFSISVTKTITEETGEGETTEKTIEDERATITENSEEKIIEWKNVEFDSQGQAKLQYGYSVPDKKPWLYLIGPIEIRQGTKSFFEARIWMIAVDANPTTKFFFRNQTELMPSEPMPNATGDNNTITQNDWNGCAMNDVVGTTAIQDPAGSDFTNAGNVYVAVVSFTSPALVPQTINSGNWMHGAYFSESGTNDDLYARFAIYSWTAADAKGTQIMGPANHVTEFATAGFFGGNTAGSTVTFGRGDKLVFEIEFYAVSPQGATGTVRWGGANMAAYDYNLIAPASIRIAGDVNAGILKPTRDANSFIKKTAFDLNVFGTCKNYSCGDTNVTLQYCITPSGCSTYFDMNTVAGSPLYISGTTESRRDDLMDASDTNAFLFSVIGSRKGYYAVRAKMDSNWSQQIRYSYENNADINLTIGKAPDANIWKVDNQDLNAAIKAFSYAADQNLTIKFRTSDPDSDDLNFNMWYGTAANAKTTVIIRDINLSTNADRGACDTNAKTGMVCTWDWNIMNVADNNYWITIEINDGTDTNTATTQRSFRAIPKNKVPDCNIWKVKTFDLNAALPTFSYAGDGNLTIKFRTHDEDNGDLNFNMWYGTSANAKTNKIIGDINLSTNSDRGACDTNAKTGMVCTWDWNISGIADNNYWITIEISDGTDTNTATTQQSFRVNPPIDLSFAIFLPAFGCTQGEGSYANNATGTCDKCFFDGNGSYNQNKIACQGQVDAAAGPSFFFFDNQSSSSTPLTWKMDLNAALPATLKLKMSQAFNGWQGTCTAGANPTSGCVDVNAASQAQLGSSIAVAVDLNAWAWADFVGVTAGSVDRNATSESLAS